MAGEGHSCGDSAGGVGRSPAGCYRPGFLVIGRQRPGFDSSWGARMEAEAWAACRKLIPQAVRAEEHAVDEASLRRAVEQLRGAGCEVLVVVQPTMGDGRLAPRLAQLWSEPVVLWATPERPDADKVSACSLVGAQAFASILRQLGGRFELVYGHPAGAATAERLSEAVRLTGAATRLRCAKVVLVGYHAPGFINMHADPAALSSQLGAELHHIGLDEFIRAAVDWPENEVSQDVEQVLAWGLPAEEGIGRDDVAVNSRLYLAMRALFDREGADAVALRCWPEMPARIGAWPYLAMSRLGEEQRPVALEGDVDGAICCLLARLLGLGPGYLSDWLGHDEDAITLWHPGHAPPSWCESGTIRLGRHFNSGHPLVVNAALAAGRPITLFRLWRCDGRYRMTAWQACTVRPRRLLAGVHGVAVMQQGRVPEWFDRLCHEGMPHHVALVAGHCADLLRRLARLLGVQWIDPP